jgi:hypothetical protein
VNQLGFVKTVFGFRESVVIRVTDAADRWFDARFGQTLGVSNGQILPATIRVMNQPAPLDRPSIMQGLFKSIENKVSFGRPRYTPSDDAISECVDDEGHIDKAPPGRHIG